MANVSMFSSWQAARVQWLSPWDKIGRVFDKCSTLGFQ
jgi:hypothetical protein